MRLRARATWAAAIARASFEAALAVVAVLAAGCAAEEASGVGPSSELDAAADAEIARSVPWPVERMPEPAERADDDAARAELGRLLFYDPILSSDRATACATCHSELWGMGDGLPRAIGVGGGALVGPGRAGDPLRRNAQSLWNVAYRSELFWDGRSSSLETQALLPLEDARELGVPPAEAVERLRAIPEYVALFDQAFPDAAEPLREASLAEALAAFQRTLISRRALYDAYLDGDRGALSDTMVAGMQLFAEMSCDGCHVPPHFSSERYAARGIGDGADLGRFEVTGEPEDRGAFRVPTLRNVRETAPYFHDGSVASLRGAVLHELSVEHARGARRLDDGEIDALLEFIQKALVDLSAEPDRPNRVPSGLAVPRDGFRIPR